MSQPIRAKFLETPSGRLSQLEIKSLGVRHQRQERRGESFDADYPNKILRERLGQHIETPCDVLTIRHNVVWRAAMADETPRRHDRRTL